jgi:hypothetical protein
MNAQPLFWPLLLLGTALVFLLVGWRLGRESAGRAMFDFPLVSLPAGPAGEEDDPWARAAVGRDVPGRSVDRNETVDWP